MNPNIEAATPKARPGIYDYTGACQYVYRYVTCVCSKGARIPIQACIDLGSLVKTLTRRPLRTGAARATHAFRASAVGDLGMRVFSAERYPHLPFVCI